jgi:hypothetical protein
VASAELDVSTTRLVVTSWIALALTLGAAMIVRLVGIDHLPGINGDEASEAVHALAWLDGAPLSSLRTGTNLPMNAPYFGVVVLLHWLLPASFLTLRLAPLAHSLLAVVLAWVLFRRRGAAFVAPLVCAIAVLPIHLGYARFAWDTSAVPTMLVLGLAAATRLRPGLTALTFVLGLWVHPVTILSLPILAAPFIVTAWPRTPDGRLRRIQLRTGVLVVLGALAVLLGIVLLERSDALPAPVLRALRGKRPGLILPRLVSPLEALSFVRLYLDLLGGPTIYRYITGSLSETMRSLHLLASAAVSGTLLWAGVRQLRAAKRSIDLAVCCGLATSLALAFAIGGLPILAPGTERYGLFVTVPSCYVLASCVAALSVDVRRAARLRLASALVGAGLLLSFTHFHLDALAEPSAKRENAFRTGDVEPKQLAVGALLAMRSPDRSAVVLVQDWWIYWPVRYLVHREPGVRVTIQGMPADYRFPSDFAPPRFDPATMELFAIAWSGGAYARHLEPRASAKAEIHGYDPGPILNVYRIAHAP